tara:strand:+ start:13782 stop:14567 length:786 start_codon:yes stop_codon:yes gene_type:complete
MSDRKKYDLLLALKDIPGGSPQRPHSLPMPRQKNRGNKMKTSLKYPAIAEAANDTRTYDQIKALVTSHRLPPRTQLAARHLSNQLVGCPESDIQSALKRLAREGVVSYTSDKGYTITSLSSKDVCTQYEASHTIMEMSLHILQNKPALIGKIKFPELFMPKHHHRSGGDFSPESLTKTTSALFIHIASRTGNPELTLHALKANDRLTYIRQCECTLIDFPVEELECLYHLYHKKMIPELRFAMDQYHKDRFKIIPRLMEIL